MSSITPSPRYFQLNEAVMRLRGGAISVHIKGLEEVTVTSDNIMLLGSNTSFQVHLQVGPAEFVPLYNMAQAVTAPVASRCCLPSNPPCGLWQSLHFIATSSTLLWNGWLNWCLVSV